MDGFARILQADCRLDPGDIVLLGFSGGPDSLALLHSLHREKIAVLAVHFDHGLRPESAEEAVRAGEIAAAYGIRFFSERGDVAGYASRNSMSIEEAARQLRYEFLFRIAAEHGAQAVAVAHNADDQVETVLMHLLRGAGPRGLRGMAAYSLPNPWSASIPLVRPFLGIWRREILEYCQTNGLDPIEDSSNRDTTYFRNRLRHELLPKLDQFSPGFRQRLHQMANLLGEETALIETLAEDAWRHCLAERTGEYIRLNRSCLLAEPLAVRRLLMRRAGEEMRPGLRDLDFDAVQRALEMCSHNVTVPQDWVAGLCLLVEGEDVWIADWEADLPVDWPQAPAQATHLEAPAALKLNSGWLLEIDEAAAGGELHNPDPFQAWLDHDRVGDELVLRRRRPGDRFQPLGMQTGSQKLADFFINEKLPRRARDGWPLLCKGEEIVWVPGHRLAHTFRLRPESRRVLKLSLQRSNGRNR